MTAAVTLCGFNIGGFYKSGKNDELVGDTLDGVKVVGNYGAFFLGVWFWRGHRESQSLHLVLDIALLGLSALGTSLGYLVARPGGEISGPDA